MMASQLKRERFESLRGRKNGTVLQIIQTLEICSTALKNDEKTPHQPSTNTFSSGHESTNAKSCLFVMPDILTRKNVVEKSDDSDHADTLTTMSSCHDSFTSAVSASSAVNKPVEIRTSSRSSRRQRRKQANTSCPYSDFGDDDLARQIEAMALGVEAAFEDRHVQKPKQSATELLDNAFSIMDEVKSPSSEGEKADTVLSTPVKNPPQAKAVDVVKDMPCSSSRHPLLLPRQMLQTPRKCDYNMPELVSSDSMASLYSTDSISTRSSSDFGRRTLMRKSRRMSLQRNAEWAIIE